MFSEGEDKGNWGDMGDTGNKGDTAGKGEDTFGKRS